MASFTKTNQDVRDHGVQYNPGQVICIEIDAGVNLTSKDGVDGALAAIVQEFSPLLYKSTGTAGKIFMVVDGHAVTAAAMQTRYQAMGTVDGIATGSLTIVERDIDAFDAS